MNNDESTDELEKNINQLKEEVENLNNYILNLAKTDENKEVRIIKKTRLKEARKDLRLKEERLSELRWQNAKMGWISLILFALIGLIAFCVHKAELIDTSKFTLETTPTKFS
eukprot:TRINITY_DN5798_c0_g1_i1.p1 TRINITY_DN5798_c0_g1~~TRINITY_DN5798_c0_g1_i1.p1  ORF type:complete len:112 (+),score=35.79 TRINITY_DN5798_c0_g1_i1:3-338(+)